MAVIGTDLELLNQLEAFLPAIKEKAEAGALSFYNLNKANSLVDWGKSRSWYSEKQRELIKQLLIRAKRQSKGVNVQVVAQHTTNTVDIDAVVAKVLERVGNEKVDVDAVAKSVFKQLDERVPRKVEIVVQKEDGKKVAVKDSPRHREFEKLLKVCTTRVNGYAPGIFLQGEASSGKTTGSRQVAEALGLAWHFNGAISFPHEMLGFIDGAGKYHRTPFREAYEKGGVYTFDEVDRSDPVALLAVNPHLANGIATFPDKQIKRHKDCIIICTANTWGLGADANYSGATKLDAAFLSRFPVRINWDIDPELEAALIPNKEWLEMVRNARTRARAVGLKVLIDTRAAQAGQALIDAGYTLADAANMTYLANLKPEQKMQLR